MSEVIVNKKTSFNEIPEISMDELENKTNNKEDKNMKDKLLFNVTGRETSDGRLQVTASVSKESIAQILEMVVAYGETEMRTEEEHARAERMKIQNKGALNMISSLIKMMK